jgi:hypothetical protein
MSRKYRHPGIFTGARMRGAAIPCPPCGMRAVPALRLRPEDPRSLTRLRVPCTRVYVMQFASGSASQTTRPGRGTDADALHCVRVAEMSRLPSN